MYCTIGLYCWRTRRSSPVPRALSVKRFSELSPPQPAWFSYHHLTAESRAPPPPPTSSQIIPEAGSCIRRAKAVPQATSSAASSSHGASAQGARAPAQPAVQLGEAQDRVQRRAIHLRVSPASCQPPVASTGSPLSESTPSSRWQGPRHSFSKGPQRWPCRYSRKRRGSEARTPSRIGRSAIAPVSPERRGGRSPARASSRSRRRGNPRRPSSRERGPPRSTPPSPRTRRAPPSRGRPCPAGRSGARSPPEDGALGIGAPEPGVADEHAREGRLGASRESAGHAGPGFYPVPAYRRTLSETMTSSCGATPSSNARA